MNNLTKRLQSIVQFVDSNDSLVDVGCDHGLLSVYLVQNNLVKKVIASDVNPNALSSAIKNIKESGLDIETVLSDGVESVNLNDINCLVIAGMGTGTIKHILEDSSKLEKINKIIIQSNNDHYMLRSFMNSIGYYLDNEIYTEERNKWYVTSCFIKSKKKNNDLELKYGFLNNDDFNNYLISSREDIINRILTIPLEARKRYLDEIEEIKRAICK